MASSWSTSLAGFALALLAAAPLRAAVAYQYEAGVASAAYAPNLTVPIYLRETLTDASPSAISAKGGLFGAGFRVSYVGGGTLPIIAIGGNPQLFPGLTAGSVTSTSATFLQAVAFDAVSGILPDPDGRILLGTVTLGSTPSALPVVFNVSRIDTLGGNTLTFSGDDLDFTTTDFTGAVTPTSLMIYSTIPEPAGLSFLAGAVFPLLSRRR
jgi:hypothetical protein